MAEFGMYMFHKIFKKVQGEKADYVLTFLIAFNTILNFPLELASLELPLL